MEQNTNFDDLVLERESDKSLIKVFIKIAFIPVIIFLIFLAGFLGVIKFKVQFHTIFMMGILLFVALWFIKHNAEFGCYIFEDRIDLFKQKLKDYIMKHLLVIGDKKKSNASFSDFVDEFSSNMRNDNYASVGSSIFPMFGILGTFISIAISMPEFSTSNINMLEKDISKLLGGVGTAFYISVYGIFLALWWTYFEKKGISKYEKLILKYKLATKNFFWDNDEITHAYMKELLVTNKDVLNSCQIISNMNFDKDLIDMMQEKIKNFKDVLEVEKNSIQSSIKNLDGVNEILSKTYDMQDNMFKKYDQILVKLDNLSTDIVVMQDEFSKQFQRAKEINSNDSSSQKIVDSIKESMTLIKDEFIELNKQVSETKIKNLDLIKDDLNNLNSELKELKNDIKEENNDIKIIVNDISKHNEELKQDLNEFKKHQEKTDEILKEVSKDIDEEVYSIENHIAPKRAKVYVDDLDDEETDEAIHDLKSQFEKLSNKKFKRK